MNESCSQGPAAKMAEEIWLMQIVVEIEININYGGFEYDKLSIVQTGFQNSSICCPLDTSFNRQLPARRAMVVVILPRLPKERGS